ncbi:MAG: hypothetical protein KF737_03195 [Phenylobacterium sp.]|nr:hypothetical protein [Phenylobacterium sp.]
MTTFNGRGRLICAARRAHGPTACGNDRSVERAHVERRVLAGLRDRLLHPEAVRAYIRTYHEAWAARQAAHAARTAPLARQLAELERRIARILDEVEDSGGSPRLRTRLAEREAERDQVAAALARAEVGEPPPIRLHPGLAEAYARRIAAIQAHLDAHGVRANAGDAASAETIANLRKMIARIDVRAFDGLAGEEVMINLRGTLAAFLRSDSGSGAPSGAPSFALAVGHLNNVVAGGGLEPPTCGL